MYTETRIAKRKELAMKASQITTRNRKGIKVVKSLAAVAVLTFFAAAPADARCRDQVQIESRYLDTQSQDIRDLGVREIQDLSTIPRIDVIRDDAGYTRGRTPIRGYGQYDQTQLRGITPLYGHTTIPIGDPNYNYNRRRDEERAQRRAIIERLKNAGVIREVNPSTKTTTSGGSGAGTTTTPPKPKVTPKPKKPKVTKLPNGDTITEYPDGRREIKMKNGDTVTTHKNGKRVIKRVNGSTTETHPSGYRKTTDRYGNGKARFPDGTTIDYKSSGEATLTDPQGNKFHRMPGKGFKPVD
jgi:hypothetical protein